MSRTKLIDGVWRLTVKPHELLKPSTKPVDPNPPTLLTDDRLKCEKRGDISMAATSGCPNCPPEVEAAWCSALATLCTLKGTPLNNSPTAKCLGCLYNSTLDSALKG